MSDQTVQQLSALLYKVCKKFVDTSGADDTLTCAAYRILGTLLERAPVLLVSDATYLATLFTELAEVKTN